MKPKLFYVPFRTTSLLLCFVNYNSLIMYVFTQTVTGCGYEKAIVVFPGSNFKLVKNNEVWDFNFYLLLKELRRVLQSLSHGTRNVWSWRVEWMATVWLGKTGSDKIELTTHDRRGGLGRSFPWRHVRWKVLLFTDRKNRKNPKIQSIKTQISQSCRKIVFWWSRKIIGNFY